MKYLQVRDYPTWQQLEQLRSGKLRGELYKQFHFPIGTELSMKINSELYEHMNKQIFIPLRIKLDEISTI